MIEIKYPILKPVPIKTKGLSKWKQIWIWLTSFRKWEVVEDYYLYVPWYNITLFIPKGFIFDGASIPRVLWPLLSPTGILFIPGLIHDYGYRYNYLRDENNNIIFKGLGQKFFDRLFSKLGAYINGMPVLDKTAYYALRLFGRFAWNEHRKNDKLRRNK